MIEACRDRTAEEQEAYEIYHLPQGNTEVIETLKQEYPELYALTEQLPDGFSAFTEAVDNARLRPRALMIKSLRPLGHLEWLSKTDWFVKFCTDEQNKRCLF